MREGALPVRYLALIGALCALASVPAAAQDIGDPEAGLAIANEACAECHEVLPTPGPSPQPDPLPFETGVALPFEEVANTPGVTAMTLFAWLQSTHPTMPNFILEDDKLTNVVAYILSLKGN
jgi:mono/diheme cytochrome c family protein